MYKFKEVCKSSKSKIVIHRSKSEIYTCSMNEMIMMYWACKLHAYD